MLTLLFDYDFVALGDTVERLGTAAEWQAKRNQATDILATQRQIASACASFPRTGDTDSLDMISRDHKDLAGIYKRMAFAGVKIVTLSEGDVSELHSSSNRF